MAHSATWAKGKRFALIVSRYNSVITESLTEGARAVLLEAGVLTADIELIHAPGTFEIPALLRAVIASKKYQGAVCLGCVVRGETSHYDFISTSAISGVSRATEDERFPCGLGVLTVETMQQALERSGGSKGNKGAEAALACLAMGEAFAGLTHHA